MHRILLQDTGDGWAVKRPGWPGEVAASRLWAEKAAESIAHELHHASGRPACVVIADGAGERVLYRFE